jgi:pilus assembly protein TadC
MSSPAGWACAIFVGLAVFWAIRSPAGAMRRVASRDGSGPSPRLPVARALLGRSDAPPLTRRLIISAAATAAVCLAVSRLGGGPSGLVWLALPPIALLLAVGLGWLEPLAARRRRQALVLQSPQALELLAACLAAGMPARAACAAVAAAFEGPVAEDLGRVMSATALGVSDAEAWRALQDHPQLGPAALDLARSVESGTRMVASLQHHAEVARERRRAALQVRARAVGVRSVLPLMTCFIPSFMLLGVVPTVVSAVTHALG